MTKRPVSPFNGYFGPPFGETLAPGEKPRIGEEYVGNYEVYIGVVFKGDPEGLARAREALAARDTLRLNALIAEAITKHRAGG
jgi:hypothetical protein